MSDGGIWSAAIGTEVEVSGFSLGCESAVEQGSGSGILLGDVCRNANGGRKDIAEDVLKAVPLHGSTGSGTLPGGGLAPDGLEGRLSRRSLRYSFSHSWWLSCTSLGFGVDEEAKNFNGDVRARKLGIDGRPRGLSGAAESVECSFRSRTLWLTAILSMVRDSDGKA